MKIYLDEVDNNLYADVILTDVDRENIDEGYTVNADVIFKRRICYVGIRKQGGFDEED